MENKLKIRSLHSILLMYLSIVLLISCKENKKTNTQTESYTTKDTIAQKLAEEYYDVSLYYATLPDYTISQIPVSLEGVIRIGRGVKLVNAFNPILQNSQLVNVTTVDVTNKNLAPLKNISALSTNEKLFSDPPVSEIRRTITWDFFTDKTISEKARALYANFSYDALFGSFEASLSLVEKYKNEGVFLMAQGTSTLTDIKLPISTSISNEAKPLLTKIEKLQNSVERNSKFFENFGTHYITGITYGYRFTFVARSESASKSMEKEASLKFQNMVASLKISASDKEYFTNNKISISANILGGNGDKPFVYLTSIEQISKFLDDLNNGIIKPEYAPIGFRLKSYNHILFSTEYPNLYALTTPSIGEKANSDFGVPKGTIIAWYPSELGTLKKDNIDIYSQVPKGWAICDGSPGTPDLRDKFLFGANNIQDVDQIGGSATHNHKGRTTGLRQYQQGEINYDRGRGKQDQYQMSMAIDADNNIPPYRKVIYIIKL